MKKFLNNLQQNKVDMGNPIGNKNRFESFLGHPSHL